MDIVYCHAAIIAGCHLEAVSKTTGVFWGKHSAVIYRCTLENSFGKGISYSCNTYRNSKITQEGCGIVQFMVSDIADMAVQVAQIIRQFVPSLAELRVPEYKFDYSVLFYCEVIAAWLQREYGVEAHISEKTPTHFQIGPLSVKAHKNKMTINSGTGTMAFSHDAVVDEKTGAMYGLAASGLTAVALQTALAAYFTKNPQTSSRLAP